MITLQAPHELPQTTCYFPGPVFNDSVTPLVEVNQVVSINDVRYTYVKNKNRKKINFTLFLPKGKVFELQAIIAAYTTKNFRLTMHDGVIWVVKLVSDPLTYTSKTKVGYSEVLLAFEGVRFYAPHIDC